MLPGRGSVALRSMTCIAVSSPVLFVCFALLCTRPPSGSSPLCLLRPTSSCARRVSRLLHTPLPHFIAVVVHIPVTSWVHCAHVDLLELHHAVASWREAACPHPVPPMHRPSTGGCTAFHRAPPVWLRCGSLCHCKVVASAVGLLVASTCSRVRACSRLGLLPSCLRALASVSAALFSSFCRSRSAFLCPGTLQGRLPQGWSSLPGAPYCVPWLRRSPRLSSSALPSVRRSRHCISASAIGVASSSPTASAYGLVPLCHRQYSDAWYLAAV